MTLVLWEKFSDKIQKYFQDVLYDNVKSCKKFSYTRIPCKLVVLYGRTNIADHKSLIKCVLLDKFKFELSLNKFIIKEVKFGKARLFSAEKINCTKVPWNPYCIIVVLYVWFQIILKNWNKTLCKSVCNLYQVNKKKVRLLYSAHISVVLFKNFRERVFSLSKDKWNMICLYIFPQTFLNTDIVYFA